MWQKIKNFLFSPPVLENLSNKVHPLDGPTRKAMAVQQPVVTAPVEAAPVVPEAVVETKPARKPRAPKVGEKAAMAAKAADKKPAAKPGRKPKVK